MTTIQQSVISNQQSVEKRYDETNKQIIMSKHHRLQILNQKYQRKRSFQKKTAATNTNNNEMV